MSTEDQKASQSADLAAWNASLERVTGTGGIILCYACRRLGHCRLGLESETLTGERRSLTRLSCPPTEEGGPGVAHGGWTAAVMDEVLGHLAPLSGRMTVTGSLTVEFLRPVPIERPLDAEVRCDRIDGHRWHNEGELRLAGTGTILARATGIFVERDPERHFARFRDWLAEQTPAK